MILSLDTSVLVAVFTVEPRSDRARGALDRTALWCISDWAAAEFSAAIRLKARRGEADRGSVEALDAGLDRLIQNLAAAQPVTAEDHRQARDLIRRHDGLRAPDALHIAMAGRLEACLITLDHDQAQVCVREGVETLIP